MTTYGKDAGDHTNLDSNERSAPGAYTSADRPMRGSKGSTPSFSTAPPNDSPPASSPPASLSLSDPAHPTYAELKEMPDVELVERFYGGDEEAFEVLVTRHSGALKHHAVAITCNWQDAEDAVQETLLAVYESMDKKHFDPSIASFKTWIHSILHHKTRNIDRRKRYFGKKGPQEKEVVEYERISDPDLLLDLLHPTVHASLTEMQKRVINDLLQGLTVAEIAGKEHCSESAIRKLRLRAIHAMRRALE